MSKNFVLCCSSGTVGMNDRYLSVSISCKTKIVHLLEIFVKRNAPIASGDLDEPVRE
jgi:hypothetical protein